MMSKCYVRFATSEEIPYGGMKVTYEVRDYDFEREAQRCGIDIKPKVSLTEKSQYKVKRGYSKFGFRMFKLTTVLNIKNGADSICYLYDNNGYKQIDAQVEGSLKVSDSEDFIKRSVFRGTKSTKKNIHEIIETKVGPYPNIKVKNNTPDPIEPKHIIKHQGFEEDDSF